MALNDPPPPLNCYGISPECEHQVIYCVDGRLWLCWTCYCAYAQNAMRANAESREGGGS